MIYITGVRTAGGSRHEHIVSVWWLDSRDGKSSTSTTDAMVEFLDRGSAVKVGGASGPVAVGVVRPNTGKPYLRTHANDAWSDNLLSLPRF